MRSVEPGAPPAAIFEEYAVLGIDDLSRLCAVDRAAIVELVEEGVLTVMHVESAEWRFPGDSLRRARRALRLRDELEINLPGVALALDLMDEIDALRRRLRVLEP